MGILDRLRAKKENKAEPIDVEALSPPERFRHGFCPSCCAKITWENELWSDGKVRTRYNCPDCNWTGMGPTKPGKPTKDSLGKPI